MFFPSVLSALAAPEFPAVSSRPSYPVDHGKPTGVRKAKRAAQKRRNVRARSSK